MTYSSFRETRVQPFHPWVSEMDSSSLNLNKSTDENTGSIQDKIKQNINGVDPDETARHEPSHLDLHCLHRCLFWSAGLKGLKYL